MLHRRNFGATLAASAAFTSGWMRTMAQDPSGSIGPGVHRSDKDRPTIPDGVAAGDVGGGAAVVWSRTDRPSRMIVDYATNEAFRDPRRVLGPAALPEDDFSARVVLTGLPSGQEVFYRVTFRDLSNARALSLPVEGRFRTPPEISSNVRFAWGGDVAGQGFGIDPARGGMRIFEAIRVARPDFFVHSGDHIYADNPIQPDVKLEDGSSWKNLVTEATSKVAETLDEYRGRYHYNKLDDHFRRFSSEVPMLAQWDDHEVTNNYYPSEWLDDARYSVKSVDLLAARARKAFFENVPTRLHPDDPSRIYRTVKYGPDLEVFLLDQRTYRGANSTNRQPSVSDQTSFLGDAQLRWLDRALKASTATWKIIASDMPIGLVVRDGPKDFEALANGEGGLPLGRELELADLLGSIRRARVRNLVWLTADVHYAAAHHYDPSRARFTDFDPFWEFVAGPLHAGTFGPSELDTTFGPEVRFTSIPPGMKPNRPPSEGLQFFGTVDFDAKSKALTVSLNDINGKRLHAVTIDPA